MDNNFTHDMLLNFRKCKIIATIGPSSSNEKILRKMINYGINVARLNFSHGDHEFHKKNIIMIRELSRELNKKVAILQDLQGPKIRCGNIPDGKLNIIAKKKYTLIEKEDDREGNSILIDYRGISQG